MRNSVVAVIACALVVGLAAWTFSAGVRTMPPSSTSLVNRPNDNPSLPAVGGVQQSGGLGDSPPALLHSVASVEKMFNRTLILPSATVVTKINSSLRLVGVRIDNPMPQNWEITIYYSTTQTFINGTTTIDDLVGKSGIFILETPVTLGANSSQVAHDELNQPSPTICHTTSGSSLSNSSSTVQCQTLSGSANIGDYIVTQNGLSLVVNPSGNIISWTDGRHGIAEAIGSRNLSIAQLLNLASTMTITA